MLEWRTKRYTNNVDIKVKLNIQSPVSTSSLYCEKIDFICFHFYIHPCLGTFLDAIPTSLMIFFPLAQGGRTCSVNSDS